MDENRTLVNKDGDVLSVRCHVRENAGKGAIRLIGGMRHPEYPVSVTVSVV